MLSTIITLVVILLVVGVLLWGLDRLPMIEGNVKQVIKILIIVAVAIYVILTVARLFGVHL